MGVCSRAWNHIDCLNIACIKKPNQTENALKNKAIWKLSELLVGRKGKENK